MTPDRSVLDAIKATAERVEQLNFEALSPGIGLGTIKPRRKAETVRASEASKRDIALASRAVPITFRDDPLIATPKNPQRRPATKPPFFDRLLRRLTAHIVDIFVIALTLLVGVKVVTYVLDPPERMTVNYLFSLLDFASYRSLGAPKLIAFVYAAFGVYWVFFKILTGLTLGESFLGQPTKSPERQQHDKRSPTRSRT